MNLVLSKTAIFLLFFSRVLFSLIATKICVFFLIKTSKIFSTFIFLELKLKFQVFSTDSDQLNLRYQTINIKNLKTKNVYLKTVMVTLLNTFVISIFFCY